MMPLNVKIFVLDELISGFTINVSVEQTWLKDKSTEQFIHCLNEKKEYPKLRNLQHCSQMQVGIMTRMECKERENQS